jgi:hypothetical protein
MPVKKTRYKLEKGLLRKGTKTAPIIVTKNKQRFVFKVFGRGVGFSQSDARQLCKQTKDYHKLLQSTGLRLSKILTISPIAEYVEGRPTGKWILAAKEQIIENKHDALQTISICNERKARDLFRQMVSQLNLVTSYKSAPNKPVQVLMDSVPKNWVGGKDGKLVYIDFFTPKLMDSKGKLSPFFKSLHTRSRSSLQFRYQNKGGIYAVLLTYVVAERPSSKKYFEKTLLDFLNKTGETDAAKIVQDTIDKNYRVDFINPNISQKIPITKV